MTSLLHIDASARPGRSDRVPHGSHTRRLTARFVERWNALRPGGELIRRDVGLHPPAPVTGEWIHAAFTPDSAREPWMHKVLAESDSLVDELLRAELIVIGAPMYNFGLPAQLKAYVDNIVRVGRTFGFDRSREGVPYWPLLAGRGIRVAVLSSRGDYGYAEGERFAHLNHAEPGLRAALGYLGITEVESVAVEYDEFADERLAASIARAEAAVDALVDRWASAGSEASAKPLATT